jgi:bifunctional ADP-heptose synthase (sugar kinase/adenylyltransferase)
MSVPQAQAFSPIVTEAARRLKERRARIAVVGDIILDNAIEADAGGFHSEFKVPLLQNATSQESIGGSANIALALSRLGVDVTLFSVIGSDLTGRQIENHLDRQPFNDYLITERGWPTPRKDWIYVREAGGERLTQRIDYDRPLPAAAREELVAEFRARCSGPLDVVILADHALGTIGPESVALVGLAKEAGAKVVSIPRSTVLRGHAVDAIVLNAAEMRRLAQAGESADAKQLATRYARDHRRYVFLTLFEEGFCVFPPDANGDGMHLKAFPLERPDWMGVRDITTAVVALGLALKLELEPLAQLCNVFRHLVAGQRGNGRVLWRDVFRFVGVEAAGVPGG